MGLLNKMRKVVIGDDMGDAAIEGDDSNFKFGLGDKVSDTITGFKGIVVRRTQWLNNCNTYGVQPVKLKEGMPQDAQNFDEMQLAVVEEKVHKEHRSTGGPDRDVPSTTNNY